MFKILIICPDPTLLLATQEFLEHEGFVVSIADAEDAARRLIQLERPDIVVISPGMRMVVTGVPAVVRMLEDPEKLLKAVRWAAREVSGQQETM